MARNVYGTLNRSDNQSIMEAAYEYLANRGLTNDTLESWLGRANARTLNKVVADLRELLPGVNESDARSQRPFL